MIPTRALVRLPDGRLIDTSKHQVNVELAQLTVLAEVFRDDEHVNLIIDGVLEVVMNRYRISYENPEFPMVFLLPCQVPGCYCQSTGPMIVQALLSETDVTLAEGLRSIYLGYLGWTRVMA